MIRIPLLSLWQQLEYWDKWLFLKINRDWIAGWADFWAPLFREKYFWAPLYLFLLVWITLRYGRKGWWWALGFITTVAASDMVSSRLFKTGIGRLRPCKDPDMVPYVRLLLDHCSGGFSFTSSHAANHFGMATFFYLSMRPVLGARAAWAYLWAFIVAYSQIYVGVHYPLDVLGGAAIGVILGAVVAIVFNKQSGFAIFDE